MHYKHTLTTCVAAMLAAIPGLSGRASLVTFDGFTIPPAGYDNGSSGHGGFTEAGAFFNNSYNAMFGSWSGFAVSNVNNPGTAGWGNQHAVTSPGTGAGGTGNYAVVYEDTYTGGTSDFLRFSSEVAPLSLRVNNTAYAAQAMLIGDAPARKFVAGDWFRLTLSAVDSTSLSTGSPIEVYLADFRDGKSDVLQNWQSVDLSPLGTSVREIRFSFSSSDNHPTYGMNTPSYAALDDLSFASAVPEPSAAGLAALGLLLLRPRRR